MADPRVLADCGAPVGACTDCCCTCGRTMGTRTPGCLCDYDGAPDLRTTRERLDALEVDLPSSLAATP